MAYKVVISNRASNQIENAIEYISVELKNIKAARILKDDILQAYELLEENADIFPFCSDDFLAQCGFKKYKLKKHDYVLLYKINGERVEIFGFFHTLENYKIKL